MARPKKSTSVKRTYVGIILDRSGSMAPLVKDVVGGYNEMAREIRSKADLGGETYVSFMMFSNTVSPVFWNRRPETLWKLDELQVGGGTALYDALGTMVERLRTAPGADEPETAFLIQVFTDGEENSSREFNGKRLAKLIGDVQMTGRWTIGFVGANLDLEKMSQHLGISLGNTLQWIPTHAGTQTVFSSATGSVGAYFTNVRGSGATASNDLYTASGETPASTNNSGSINVGRD